jgi:hypothetical protein
MEDIASCILYFFKDRRKFWVAVEKIFDFLKVKNYIFVATDRPVWLAGLKGIF